MALSIFGVTVTGLGIGVLAYRNATQTVSELSARIFDREADYATARAEDYAASARHQLNLLVRVNQKSGLTNDMELLGLHLADIIRANPRLSSAGFGSVNGNATWASTQADGATLLHRYTGYADGVPVRQTFEVSDDGELTLLLEEPTTYDAHVRPWYKLGLSAQEPAWTEPYLFLPGNIPGITLVHEALDASGEQTGVFFVDFNFIFLSKALHYLNKQRGSVGVIFDNAGNVLAHSDPAYGHHDTPDGVPRIARLDDHPEPLTQMLGALDRTADPDDPPLLLLEHNGEAYAVGIQQARTPDSGLVWNVAIFMPERLLLGHARDGAMYNALLALMGLLLTLGLSLRFSSGVTTGFYAFYDEMKRLGRLELEDRPRPSARILEVEQLGEQLDNMRKSLRSFERYVPSALVQDLMARGIEAKPGGDSHHITVMFTDIVGFTTISEQLQPQDLADRLGEHLHRMSELIREQGGTVDKYIGDAIMAFWNAPGTVEDHPMAACTAALQMIATIKASEIQGARALWPIRIGLNTTQAVVGNFGSPNRLNYTAVGDGVNLASRLEALNKDYGTHILVTETTVATVGETFLTRPVDRVVVKGQSRAETVFELIGSRSDTTLDQQRWAQDTHEAFDAYLEQRWDDALRAYQRCLVMQPDDGVALRLYERCQRLKQHPPRGTGDGVMV